MDTNQAASPLRRAISWRVIPLRPRHIAAAALSAALAFALVPLTTSATQADTTQSPTPTVQGNRLVDGDGTGIRLIGVNRSGAEYACAQGWGFFDGPVDATTLELIKSWGSNTVRVPMNETCWLGINGVSPQYSGQAYQTAISDFVDRINAAGMLAILDLHWNAPGTNIAYSQQVMADADHSPDFWASVAATFADNPSVAFDLYNEPHDISWNCWRDGCTTAEGWEAAGMQDLVNAVRGTGARNLLIASGLNWGGDLSEWVAHAPTDPLNNLAAGVHIYSFSECNTESCWDATIAEVAKTHPVVSTEIGEDTCTGEFTSEYMDWADRTGVGYTPWSWSTADCRSGQALLTNYDGTPTTYGAAVRDHMQNLSLNGAINSFGPKAVSQWTSRSEMSASRKAHSGRRSLEVKTGIAPGQKARVSVADTATSLSAENGNRLAVWIRVSPDSPRNQWQGRLSMRDSNGTWVHGDETQLRRGTWTQVTFTPTGAQWDGNSGIKVRIRGEDRSLGLLKVQIDTLTQGW